MQKFEYLDGPIKSGMVDYQGRSAIGELGWELVSVVPQGSQNWAYLKRVVQAGQGVVQCTLNTFGM